MSLIAWIQLLLIGAAIGAVLLLIMWWKFKKFTFNRLVLLTVFFTFDLILFGAFTRLSDSGLGCPDWPGCYGHLVVQDKSLAQPVESVKAWTEMIHRYLAGSLVLLIVCLGLGVRYVRRNCVVIPCGIPIFLLFLLASQAALGMWTVTLKL